MTDNEQKCLLSVNTQEWCELGAGLPADDTSTAIAGSFIRDLLLGGLIDPRSHAYGVRLQGAYIKGPIDLRDGRNPDHGPLPPLLLEHCRLEGNPDDEDEAVLNARHASLSRLSLTGCRIGMVDLSDASVDGDLAIDGVAPLNDTRKCQLSARGARFNGRINARGSTFRIDDDARIPDFGDIADFAFDLNDAYVDSSVYLFPDFKASGGVSMMGARIEGNILCLGAHLSRSDRWAFRGQTLSCRGVVWFSSTKERATWLDGEVDLLGATLGSFVMNGVDASNSSKLEMENAVVATSVHISSPRLKKIALKRARIQGTLVMQPQVSKEDEAPRQELDAYKLCVNGDILIENFRGTIGIGSADIGGNVTVEKSDLSCLDASGAVVRGKMSIETIQRTSRESLPEILAPNLDVKKALSLQLTPSDIKLSGSVVANDVLVELRGQSRDDGLGSIQATNVHFQNNCKFKNISGTLEINNADIDGRLDISANALASLDAQDMVVRGRAELTGSLAQNLPRHHARLDGSRFEGDLHLDEICFLQAAGTVPALCLNHAQVARDLELQHVSIARPSKEAWMAIEPVGSCSGPLGFYPGWTLYEAQYEMSNAEIGIIAFLKNSDVPPQLILLPGNAATIHAFNGSGALKLEAPADVARYLCFYASHVWADDGPFVIIESAAELGPGIGDASVGAGAFHPVEVTRRDHLGWQCTAVLAYAAKLFECTFTVDARGSVSMESDRPIGELKEAPAVRIAKPLRIVRPAANGIAANHAAGHYFLVAGAAPACTWGPASPALNSLLRQLAGDGSQERYRKLSAIVSLADVKAGGIKFPGREAWGQGVLVELEGFDYGRFDATTLVAASFLSTQGLAARMPSTSFRSRLRRLLSRKPGRPDLPSRDWLYLQFPDRDPRKQPPTRQFSRQPHEHLAQVLRRQGDVDEAIEVVLNGMRIESRLTTEPAKRCLSTVSDVFFRHLLRPTQGIYWCLTLLVLGGAFFDYANYGVLRWFPQSCPWVRLDDPVLVVDAAAVSPLIKKEDGGAGSPSMELASAGDARLVADLRCGDQVDPVLYPIDLFIPLLNLRQQDKCTITNGAWAFGFRLFKFVYTVLGSIFISLTLFSIADRLRRRLEQ
jgi:hypothetical protein